ncbi:major head protein [Pseudomonas phage vB_PaeS_PAJD-1]|uniref:Major head protein n=3 Tax=Viruses TaxID=10239 RepID=A0A0S0N2Q7_9CAUD|nr:major head protein [Pseudomonas phage PaMx25]YP_010719649.1 major head protein [Pseudomonas phage vB_PaeS_PAJD-1]ALH23820.1 major head protein [Pseudomonas phage PaMx25]QTP92325.1 major head protein [Pseudomonas phage vB_PaeS_PAJD-1]
MASGVTRIADVVVPEIFSPYVQQMTQEKSRLIRSGAIVLDAQLNSALAGGGLTFNEPSFKDLDNDAENVSTDDPATDSTPNKIGTATEIQVRLSRNNSWSSMDLSGDLAGADPMQAIANRVSDYWTRRQQAAFVATLNGVFADNAAAPTGTEHVQNDMTHDVSGASFVDGVTNFSAESFIDATATMGDSMEDLTMVMVHSIVYARMLKNNLIDFVSDSVNGNAVRIPTFLGREVIVDDGVPRSSGVFNTWLFGRGAVRGGMGSPKVPTEVDRKPSAGNGGGQDILFNRTEWIIHPVGHAYAGTPPNGGPSNASTTNNLAHADSWKRVFSERKQIRIARLITREF